ncbi:penicillin acylase family protein [Chloroflexi bacterium TSY]|nr:penicillin acylase family protein [Chloroflexi bacterium TSY]
MRRTFLIFFSIVIVILILVGGGWLYLRSSLPQTSGSISIDGLDGTVDIIRDEDGVPHIFATTDHDAFFALGYVHAQDRMWQMEFQRRVGAGRLSEILGEQTLKIDQFLRTVGVYRAAQAAWPALNAQAQDTLDAYASGVNSWLKQNHTLPVEFLVLGVEPEPWTVFDSLVWVKMMAWDLGGDYDEELLRLKLGQILGPERANDLLQPYPVDGINILAQTRSADPLVATVLEIDTILQRDFHLGGIDVGSNNWVISGDWTESGQPLLANDPHLGSRIPSVWYLAELQGDNLHVIGATLPGLPGIAIGHNEQIAWGLTNVDPDVQDLYIERLNPANPNQVEVNGEWQDMEIIEELISVDGMDEPIRWAARATRHGPLISDVSETTLPVSMRWTALAPNDTTFEAFLAINYARNWIEFKDAMRDYVAPSQNFVYADVEGNIGYFVPGQIPIRNQGTGAFPSPGWNDEYGWTGFIPFEDLPQAFNPDQGFIASANNRVVDDSYPYFLSNSWSPLYRAERIMQLIAELTADGRKVTMSDMMAIQADQRSTQVDALLPNLLSTIGDALEGTTQEEDEKSIRRNQALSFLQNWDRTSSGTSPAAAIYEAWFVHLGRAVFEDDLPEGLFKEVANRKHPTLLAEIYANPDEHAGWCDNVRTPSTENCADLAQLALDQALDDLRDRLGQDMDQWQWADLHKTQYPHNPFSQVPFLRPFFHRSIETGGNTYTINVAPVNFDDLYNQNWVPSYRQIVDLANLDKSLFMHTTGQSGHLLSDHYDDLIERHRDVVYLPMHFGREKVAGERLTLESR